ncbi:hypothetical protein DY000_02021899 [Brassica cretica]|uniref:Uncharacterized protein n=1 Tax=Brassica cretica TaxID=69181 RepID=A0ABQ7EH92_BRACR|nr:hypothetical protein DY000_02021899 [Brassica cretica]
MLPLGVLAGTTTRQDVVKLVITINRSSRPPSCSSRRDEAVDTNHAAIGARMKPLEPPEVSPLRACEVHAPPPEIVAAAFAAGNRRRHLRRRRIQRRTSVCRIVWRLRPTLVDRLSCSLEMSINRPRAVSEHYLELCYVFGLVASHTSLSDSPVAHPSLFPFSGGDGCYNLVSDPHAKPSVNHHAAYRLLVKKSMPGNMKWVRYGLREIASKGRRECMD